MTPVPTIAANTWHHAVLTYNGSTATFYFDGAQMGTYAIAGPIGYGPYPIVVGADFGLSPVADYFPGIVDQLGVWNRVLTASEL